MKVSPKIKNLAKDAMRAEISLIDIWAASNDYQQQNDLTSDEMDLLRFEMTNIRTKIEAMLFK